jgi:hypothetical protein
MMQPLFTAVCFFLAIADGFSPLQRTWGRPTPRLAHEGLGHSMVTALWSTVTNDDGQMEIANDFKMFLTQCSIQSFMFLLFSMRDPQTVMWLEEFSQPAIVSKETILGVTILQDARMPDEQAAMEDVEEDFDEGDYDEECDEEDEDEICPAEEPRATNELSQYHDIGELNFTVFSTLVLYFVQLLERLEEFLQSAIVRTERGIPDMAILQDARMVGEHASMEDDEDDDEASEDDSCPVEEPRKTSKLLQYHGLAALNSTLFPSWLSYFEQLLEHPTETFIVESSVKYIPDYDLEIDPSSLCSRIVSVREQISKEFVKDLQVISEMGGKTLEWYWESLKQKHDDDTKVTIQRENLFFLELNADSNSNLGPSPLRKGNFDLLILLCTQESIHRVLQHENRQDGPERATNEFLRAFYQDRMHYFRGPQNYGRADDFVEELLSASPRMITVAEGVTHLLDPTRIAEILLNQRKEVALEWKQVAAESPKEHMEIQRMRLNRLMGVKVKVDEESFQ